MAESSQLSKARHGAEARNFGVKNVLCFLSSFASVLCFVFMLDVLVFVKQHKLVQYIVWIESIFFFFFCIV